MITDWIEWVLETGTRQWSAATSTMAAIARLCLYAGMVFVATLSFYSPQERLADMDAAAMNAPKPDTAVTPWLPEEPGTLRILVMGSSETGLLFKADDRYGCPNIADCLEEDLSSRISGPVDVNLRFVPASPGERVKVLDEVAQENPNIDILVLTYAVHSFANEISTERTEKQAEPASNERPSLVNFALISPLGATNSMLTKHFYAYETRFRYSLAQKFPFGGKVVVVPFGDQPEAPGSGNSRSRRENAATPGRRPDFGPDPNFASFMISMINRAQERRQNVTGVFELLLERAKQVAPRTIFVLTPAGTHYFSEDELDTLRTYADSIGEAAAGTLVGERVIYINALDLHEGAASKFSDPAHLVDFEPLAEIVASEIVRRGWAAPTEF